MEVEGKYATPSSSSSGRSRKRSRALQTTSPVRKALFRSRGRKVVPTSVTMPRAINGFPDRIRTKLVYSDRFSFTTGSGNAYVMYRGNSCYSPLYTATGNTIAPVNEQPQYFDKYTPLYQSYRVHASKIELTAVNNLSSTSFPVLLNLYPTDAATTPTTTVNEERVTRRNKQLMIPAGSVRAYSMKHYISTAAVNGITPDEASVSSLYAAGYNANPADVWYWVVHSSSFDETTGTSLLVTVKLTFYVEFNDPYAARTND